MSALRIGMKVVLIDDNWPDYVNDEIMPVLGTVYTIREIIDHRANPIRLVEIQNPIRTYRDGTGEVGFRASRFRPVVERKTDIAIFKVMLTKTRISVPA